MCSIIIPVVLGCTQRVIEIELNINNIIEVKASVWMVFVDDIKSFDDDNSEKE